eukprot:1078349-Prorocentrum_minimum.AAC.4
MISPLKLYYIHPGGDNSDIIQCVAYRRVLICHTLQKVASRTARHGLKSWMLLRRVMGGENKPEKKDKKKEKKEKKKLKEQENEVEETKELKKEKKKKRKDCEAEEEPAPAEGEKKKKKKKEVVEESEEEEEAPKKKKKKKDKTANGGNEGKTRQSRGGDFTYKEHADISAMSSQDILAIREKRGMTVDTGGTNDVKPVTEFIHAQFPSKLEKWMLKCAAGAPGLQMCSKHPVTPGKPIMACVAPTRELALQQFLSPANNVPLASCCALVTNTHTHTHTSCIGGLTRTQIAEVLNLAGAVLGVEAAVVFGGMPKYQQVKALKTAHVVVATPGRLQDLMQVTNVNSSRVNQGKKRGHVSCWFDPRVSESESGRQCDETVRARAHF